MSTPYEIPLSANAQTFTISLANVTYKLTLRWNEVSSCWVLDIADASRVNILCGVPIVTGCDLFGQYEYLAFGGQLIAQSDYDLTSPPNYNNLGSEGHIYFVVP